MIIVLFIILQGLLPTAEEEIELLKLTRPLFKAINVSVDVTLPPTCTLFEKRAFGMRRFLYLLCLALKLQSINKLAEL